MQKNELKILTLLKLTHHSLSGNYCCTLSWSYFHRCVM